MYIAVEKGHFDIVKHILVNSSYIDLSDTGKSPLFLAAEKGYRDILVLSLYSKYLKPTSAQLLWILVYGEIKRKLYDC